MKPNKAIFALLLVSLLSACAIHEGESRHIQPPTLGSELIQLQKAFEEGALSELEYRRAKRDLLDAKPDYRHGYFPTQPKKTEHRENKQ